MNPILDQPQSIENEQLQPTATYRLANQDLCFAADAQTDLIDLVWPWANTTYARRIQLRVLALRDDALTPLVTRYYPGYQEVIMGNEGMIVSKRLVVPLNSSYDRAVLWVLECQAEGDRLLRLEVDIEWAEPLSQRMVDDILVAQRNPGPARGIYAQSNADSTVVFGNPNGRADFVEISDPQRARLVYHVLVNGMVEVPLLLAVSDVGEQVAWNGFLALRDSERTFELSNRAWSELVKAGRLWTPDANLNRAVQASKVETVRWVQRLRSGVAPTDREIVRLPELIASLDLFDPTQSRNLLAHTRRLAERSQGRLPALFPLRAADELPDPGQTVLATNHAYLLALYDHLRHHFDLELLGEHYEAVKRCAETLIQVRWQAGVDENITQLVTISAALRRALGMAMTQNDGVNAVRWESEACEAERRAEALGWQAPDETFTLAGWLLRSTWQTPDDRPWAFAAPGQGIALTGQVIWRGCGLQWDRGHYGVEPAWPAAWSWWAVLDLPIGKTKLSLLWDGTTLHATQPIHSKLPVQVQQRISAQKTDEHEFDLQFELRSEHDGVVERQIFRPTFLEQTP